MTKTKVSIIMSTYNDAKYIKNAIDSVLNQTYQNWEFLIIDDASNDSTLKILDNYRKIDKRIRLYKNQINKGLTPNLNYGISLSKGEYIGRIDSDDEWISTKKLEKQILFLESHKEYGLVGTFAYAVNPNGKRLFNISYPYKDQDIREVILKHNCFLHSSIVIKKSILTKIGIYNEDYAFSQDYDMVLRIGTISKFYILPEFYVNYTINPYGTSVTKYQQQTKQTISIIKKYRYNYPNFFSGYMMWNLRFFYPNWFRGAFSRRIKSSFMKLWR